jgi:hypothetical protein
MQVDPSKPTLKAPRFKRLIPTYDQLVSNFGFNFNLRRFTTVADAGTAVKEAKAGDDKAGGLGFRVKGLGFRVENSH